MEWMDGKKEFRKNFILKINKNNKKEMINVNKLERKKDD